MQAEAARPRQPAPSQGAHAEPPIATQLQLAGVLGKPHLLRSGRLAEILLDQE